MVWIPFLIYSGMDLMAWDRSKAICVSELLSSGFRFYLVLSFLTCHRFLINIDCVRSPVMSLDPVPPVACWAGVVTRPSYYGRG